MVCEPAVIDRITNDQTIFEQEQLIDLANDKKLAVRLSTEEWELLKEMHMKNGTTMSETMRRSFFKTHYHHFKGVSHKAIK